MKKGTAIYLTLMLFAMLNGAALMYRPAYLLEGLAGLALVLLGFSGTFFAATK